jgi:hypothetical protein
VDATGRFFGRLDSARTPGRHNRSGTLLAFTRAVVSPCDCCLLEETTCSVLIRAMPNCGGRVPAKMGPYQECPSENRNRTLYLRRMRLGTILAAVFALASERQIGNTFNLREPGWACYLPAPERWATRHSGVSQNLPYARMESGEVILLCRVPERFDFQSQRGDYQAPHQGCHLEQCKMARSRQRPV